MTLLVLFLEYFQDGCEPGVIVIVVLDFLGEFDDDFGDMTGVDCGFPAQKVSQKYLRAQGADSRLKVVGFSLVDCERVEFENFGLFPKVRVHAGRKGPMKNKSGKGVVDPLNLLGLKVNEEGELVGVEAVVEGGVEVVGDGLGKGNGLAHENKFVLAVLGDEVGPADGCENGLFLALAETVLA